MTHAGPQTGIHGALQKAARAASAEHARNDGLTALSGIRHMLVLLARVGVALRRHFFVHMRRLSLTRCAETQLITDEKTDGVAAMADHHRLSNGQAVAFGDAQRELSGSRRFIAAL